MSSKLLIVLLLALTATAVLGSKTDGAHLQKRADGMLSKLIGFTGSLTQSAVSKGVEMGYATMDNIKGIINYGADSLKSGANVLLRRDMGLPLNYDTMSANVNKAMSDMNSSWRAANQLATNLRPNLSERGQSLLDDYMRQLKISRDYYKAALQDAAATTVDLNNRISSSTLGDDSEIWDHIQDLYSAQMMDFGQHVTRLGRVIKNNGFDI